MALSSLNTQFVHWNEAITYLNGTRMSSPTWSSLLDPYTSQTEWQQSSRNSICALDGHVVSSLPTYPASLAPPDGQGSSPNHPSNSFIAKAFHSLKIMVKEHVMCINVNTPWEGGKKPRHRLWRKAQRNAVPHVAPSSASQAPGFLLLLCRAQTLASH